MSKFLITHNLIFDALQEFSAEKSSATAMADTRSASCSECSMLIACPRCSRRENKFPDDYNAHTKVSHPSHSIQSVAGSEFFSIYNEPIYENYSGELNPNNLHQLKYSIESHIASLERSLMCIGQVKDDREPISSEEIRFRSNKRSREESSNVCFQDKWLAQTESANLSVQDQLDIKEVQLFIIYS